MMPVAVGKEEIRFEECLDAVIAFELTTLVDLKGKNIYLKKSEQFYNNHKKLVYRSCARGGLPKRKVEGALGVNGVI